MTENSLRERALRFEALFEDPDVFACLVQPDGTVISANRTMTSVGEAGSDEVKGIPFWELPLWSRAEESPETLRERVGRAVQGERVRFETEYRRSDGTRTTVDGTIRPVTDDAGVDSLVFTGRLAAARDEPSGERDVPEEVDATVTGSSPALVGVLDEDGNVREQPAWSSVLHDDVRSDGREDAGLYELLPSGVADSLREARKRCLETGDRAVVEHRLEVDGWTRWFEGCVSPPNRKRTDADPGDVTFIVQDVTDRKRPVERLANLNRMLAELMEVDRRQTVCDVVADAAAEELNLPVTAIALLDDEKGSLRTVASTPGARRLPDDARLHGEDGAAWRSFISGEPTVLENPPTDGDPIGPLAIQPLGRYGVLVTALSPPGAPTVGEEFVETVAENLWTALERVERQALLRDRESRLEEQNEWLDRLNRINDVIRRIDRVLVGATTREEIDRAVCQELANAGPYRFVWTGQRDHQSETVVPRQSAGVDKSFLDAASFPFDEEAGGREPVARALRTREPAVVDDVLVDPPVEQWREVALGCGFRSCIALPLCYRDRLYGVLTVYGDRPGLFDELERQILLELSETIAHAIDAIERRKALLTDSVVELEFEVEPEVFPVVAETTLDSSCQFEMEGVVPASADTFRVFFTITDVQPARVLDVMERSVVAEDCRLVTDRDGKPVFEFTVTEESFVFWLLDRGAVPTALSGDETGVRVVVELSQGADVRSFVESLESAYSGVNMLARREWERTTTTRQKLRSAVEDRLTARQEEVLQTAYMNGYFESPREHSGGEVADTLDISQPTFNDHLRIGLRKLMERLYEEDG